MYSGKELSSLGVRIVNDWRGNRVCTPFFSHVLTREEKGRTKGLCLFSLDVSWWYHQSHQLILMVHQSIPPSSSIFPCQIASLSGRKRDRLESFLSLPCIHWLNILSLPFVHLLFPFACLYLGSVRVTMHHGTMQSSDPGSCSSSSSCQGKGRKEVERESKSFFCPFPPFLDLPLLPLH